MIWQLNGTLHGPRGAADLRRQLAPAQLSDHLGRSRRRRSQAAIVPGTRAVNSPGITHASTGPPISLAFHDKHQPAPPVDRLQVRQPSLELLLQIRKPLPRLLEHHAGAQRAGGQPLVPCQLLLQGRQLALQSCRRLGLGRERGMAQLQTRTRRGGNAPEGGASNTSKHATARSAGC